MTERNISRILCEAEDELVRCCGLDAREARAQAVLLMCAASPVPEVFSGAHATYKNMLGYLKWPDAGIISVNNVDNPGDISKTPYLAEAEKLGAKL